MIKGNAGWVYDEETNSWSKDFTDTTGMTCEIPLEEYERLKQIEKDYVLCMKMLR